MKMDSEMPHRYSSKESHLCEEEHVDVAIIGAGAAGLFAAIWAGRNSEGPEGAGIRSGGASEDRPAGCPEEDRVPEVREDRSFCS